MNQKNIRLAFIACIVIFVVALVLSLAFSQDPVNGFQGSGGGHIVISEVLASNRTYPAPNGQYLDYIEVRNLSATPTDISGYMLSDAEDSIGYTFPQGTVLQPNGYAICWCDKNDSSGKYGTFGISKDGSDTIYLYNSANVLVDEVELPVMQTNIPLIRLDDGSWDMGSFATPCFENTEEGHAKWLASMGASNVQVVISEVMTGSTCSGIDTSGRISDWVELWNRGDTAVNLDGAYLSDEINNLVKYKITGLTLQPGERKVIRCAGDDAQVGDANFSLSRDGCTVTLSGVLGNVVSQVEIPLLGKDIAWSLQEDGTYAATEKATPGYENTDAGYGEWLLAMGVSDIQVIISEVMTGNYSTITGSAGSLCDWVELYNPGTTTAVLTGGYLSNDGADRGKWQIPELEIRPGQRVVIRCAGIQAADGEAGFGLSRDGCQVVLSGPAGNVIAKAEVPAMEKDRVWALQSDGSYEISDLPTPGFENTEAGYQAYNETRVPAGLLMISEVMPSNASYLRQSDGKCYDWVELVNIGDHALDLSDYSLASDPDAAPFALPQRTLNPGERIIVICSGNSELGGNYIHAPFTLSRDESWVYVIGPEGGYSDYIRISDVPYQGSVGRTNGKNGTYYFTKPTPGDPNGTGVGFISATPEVLTAGGVYNDVDSVVVELSGTQIRYTTDGSLPTANSRLYTQPLILDETTVIRFASFETGKLRSDVVTASYIINENHTLPVISLTTDPDDLFGGAGLYVNYWTENEIPCNVTLFEGDGGFSIDCGLKMFGHMGLENPKKSFKINFRGRYGQDYLTYPVYGEDGPLVYDSLVIRSGQDYPKTVFRDELFTSLCREASDVTLAQRYKFCILYINGEYFGIYSMKEAFGETMYAENYGVSAESVTVTQAPVDATDPFFQIIRYCIDNDLSVQENYEYYASLVDVDSLIDWMIMEAYCANTDVQQNLRYFKSSENGDKWQFAYYDIDWGWYFYNGFINVLSPDEKWQHMPLCRAPMKNAEFREKFFTRVAELKNGVLSDEHVLEQIDYFAELLEPEIARERERWGSSYDAWVNEVERMRKYLTTRDHWGGLINHLFRFAGMTNAEYKKYFGG